RPGQGKQNMPQDDRPGQPAADGAPVRDVVFDQPDRQQVEPEERGHQPADQGGNTHGPPLPCIPEPCPAPRTATAASRSLPGSYHSRARSNAAPGPNAVDSPLSRRRVDAGASSV